MEQSGEDDIDLEETVHDYDKMVAMSVIEAEMELMQTFIKTTKDAEKREFFKDKLGNLEYSKSTIMGNIECGIMTPEKYIINIKKYLADQEKLAADLSKKMGKGNDHVKRVFKRVELLRAEIQESESP